MHLLQVVFRLVSGLFKTHIHKLKLNLNLALKLLSVHLASTHNLPKDQRYYQLLNEAKFYYPSLLPENISFFSKKKIWSSHRNYQKTKQLKK